MTSKGPVFGLEAMPQPSWLQEEEEEEQTQHTAKQSSDSAAGSSSSGDRRAYVFFTTDLPEPLRLPPEPLSIETTFRRTDLSKLVNRLLQEQDRDTWPQPQPLDFLVDGKIFLKGSLREHMQQYGLTAEVSVQLHYQLATRKGEERVLPPSRDWISGVSIPCACGPIVEASYDGHLRLHSAASPDGFLAAKEPLLLHEVFLRQGPLAGVECVDVAGEAKGRLACFAATQKGGLLMLSLARQGDSWGHSLSSVGTHGGPAACIAASADAGLAAVGGAEGNITLWDTRAAAVAALTQPAASSKDAAGSSSRQKRRVGGDGETAQCVALRSPMRLSASPSSQRVTAIKFGRGHMEGQFVSCCLDGSLRLWGVGGGDAAHWRCEAAPLGVAFSPSDARLLAVAHEDYRVRLWDVRTPEGGVEAGSSGKRAGAALRLAFKGRHARLPSAVSWSSNSNLLASVGQDGCVLVQDVRSPAAALVVFKAEVAGLPVRLLCCDWLGSRAVASGGSDGRVRLHGLVSGA